MQTMLLSFLLASLFLLPACDSDPLNPEGVVTMDINGTAWSANLAPYAVYDDVLLNMSIHGSNDEDETSLVIDVTDCSGPGTWELTSGGDGVFFRKFIQQEKYETNEFFRGEMIITTMNDTRVKGSFSFDAMLDTDSTRVIEVRNGKFDVTYLD